MASSLTEPGAKRIPAWACSCVKGFISVMVNGYMDARCVCVSHTLYQRACTCLVFFGIDVSEFYYVSRGLEYDSEVSNQRRRFWSHSDMILGRWNHVPAPFHETLWSTNVWFFRGFLVWTSCWCLLFRLKHAMFFRHCIRNPCSQLVSMVEPRFFTFGSVPLLLLTEYKLLRHSFLHA